MNGYGYSQVLLSRVFQGVFSQSGEKAEIKNTEAETTSEELQLTWPVEKSLAKLVCDKRNCPLGR